MIDSTNPRCLADNIRHLAEASGSQASDISTLQTTVTALGAYSTDEVDTGMKYGESPIYRKIFTAEALPNSDTLAIPHGITNLGQVLELRGIATASGSGFPFDYRNIVYLGFTATNINIVASGNFSTYSAVVIIEYTKSASPAALTSPVPDDIRSIDLEEIPDAEDEPVIDEPIEEEPIVSVKKTTTRKKTN